MLAFVVRSAWWKSTDKPFVALYWLPKQRNCVLEGTAVGRWALSSLITTQEQVTC